MARLARRFALGAALLSLAACSAPGVEDEDGAASAQAATAGPRLCAAVRGNGELILTHFASLARLVEHYGVFDGMAGGSSGSITTFAYESMRLHPAMNTCGDGACSEEAKASRVALALKSSQGYADAVAGSPEAVAVRGLADLVGRIRKGYTDKGIEGLAPEQAEEAAARLREVLSVPEVAGAVNPEVFTMLADREHLAFHVGELKTSIEQLGAFKVDDNRLFFRAPVLNWPALAVLFGRVGDFYAGYGPSDHAAMGAWLDACAEPTRGMPWAEAASVPTASGGTCGEAFAKMLGDFRGKVRGGASYASRIDERVGKAGSPVRTIVTTAVLEGSAKEAYASALASYRTGAYPTGQVPFAPEFEDVRFGYWGSASDVGKLLSNPKGFEDLKTRKATSLGDATWRTVLAASPAEPGLSRFVLLPDGRFSAGGWSDLAPTLALENLGCRDVVYVTREGDESKFAVAIAKHAGMSEAAWRALYDLSNEASSYARSVAAADAVWCTKWNDFGLGTMPAAVLDAYGAPMETRAGFADVRALRPYVNASSSVGRVGCTAGLAGSARYPR